MHVVLVDPSRTVLKAVSQILEARGHAVDSFSDGYEALAHLRSDENVDALITSTEPIGIPGVQLCWEARLIASSRRPLYIIMMSSSRERTSLCEALDSGADDFIEKPPAPEELYARIRAAERLVSLERDLVRLATTDPLTGVLNRRAFFEGANAAAAQATRGIPLSAIMIDIDHFKKINDNYGHDQGDRALGAVTQAAMAEAPKLAIFGRLGGEEFALVLPRARLVEAATLAERLRKRISELRQETGKGPLSMTCSFGVSDWRPGDDIDIMLKRADDALYAAKSGGRNRVVTADDIATTGRSAPSVVKSGEHRAAFRISQKRTFRISMLPNRPPAGKP